jgi:multidrug efflux pump subunit AcrA (membrane-fusion protein)
LAVPQPVARIANALDPATRTLMTEIDVPNPDGELSPGLYCTVELKVPRRTPSLIVPAGAIVFDRDGLHVLVVEEGVVHSRKITEIRDLRGVAADGGPEVRIHLPPAESRVRT